MHPKIRYGMVGGGIGANMGHIHQFAARLDNDYELVCGVFSRDYENSIQTGLKLGIAQDRIYPTYTDMFAQEVRLPAQERMQLVSIVTPNSLHFPMSQAALEQGFHVFCEKPFTNTLAEAKELQALALAKNLLFGVNFTKAGYPMIKQMRSMTGQQTMGSIRKIFIDYRVSGLEFDVEHSDNKQMKWRIDPRKDGPFGTLGDIGSHSLHLAEYVSHLTISKLSAHFNYLMQRPLEDDATLLLKFNTGASGVITLSQVLPGEVDNLSVTLYGEQGGIKWHTLQADQLELYWQHQPIQILRAGPDNRLFDALTLNSGRVPGGRDEGHIGALANHYRELAKAIYAQENNDQTQKFDYPDIRAGVRNMALLEAARLSAASANKWVDVV